MLQPPTERCTPLDKLDALILLELEKNPNGTSKKELMEAVERAKTTVRDRLTKLGRDKLGFVVFGRLPGSNAETSTTNFYFLSESLTAEELQYITQLAQADPTQSSRSTAPDVNQGKGSTEHQESGKLGFVAEAVNLIKATYRMEHLVVLAGVVKLNQPTINQLSFFTGAPKQTTHSRAMKLMEVALVDREKCVTETGAEYVYFLAPGINEDEVIDLLRSELGEHEFALLTETLNKQTEVKQMASSSNPSTNSASRKSHSSRFDSLAHKLPEFDPTWSDELKQKWFRWYDRLMSVEDVDQKDC